MLRETRSTAGGTPTLPGAARLPRAHRANI